jgi:hypothetical protein
MEIHVTEQVQRALEAKAAEGHFASVHDYVQALLHREALQGTASSGNDLDRFHQELRQAGLLLSHNETPLLLADEPFEPVTIAGLPLSATIIGERR